LAKKEPIGPLVDHLFRSEYGRLVAFLTYTLGFDRLQDAEDIAQETLIAAYHHWPHKGVPNNPSAWLFKVAKNKCLNLIQQKKSRKEHLATLQPELMHEQSLPVLENEIEDSMLRMIFACCSPAISYENQVLLILNTLGGFSRKEIANAFFLEEETVKKRLFRVKKEIRQAQIRLSVPVSHLLKPRLNAVYHTLYLLFNEGYNTTHREELIRKDTCLEAMRLTKLLHKQFPNETSGSALLALMCFHVARFESRIDNQGAIVLFHQQNRSLWNRTLIDAGITYLAEASVGEDLTTYHLEANIAAEHCTAASFEETNWELIHKLYSWLLSYKPSPIVKLNVAIVSSKLKGYQHAIEQLLFLQKKEPKLKNHYLLHATLGEFYKATQQNDLAVAYLKEARSLTESVMEKELLTQKILPILNRPEQ
jgi:RNA polymerase sigma factor (sigma-70 family)